MCWWCGNPLCGLCSIITCMCRPVNKKYDELPLWAQCLVSFVFVGIPVLVATFVVAYFLDRFYYG